MVKISPTPPENIGRKLCDRSVEPAVDSNRCAARRDIAENSENIRTRLHLRNAAKRKPQLDPMLPPSPDQQLGEAKRGIRRRRNARSCGEAGVGRRHGTQHLPRRNVRTKLHLLGQKPLPDLAFRYLAGLALPGGNLLGQPARFPRSEQVSDRFLDGPIVREAPVFFLGVVDLLLRDTGQLRRH
jgi:hypothetical protein